MVTAEPTYALLTLGIFIVVLTGVIAVAFFRGNNKVTKIIGGSLLLAMLIVPFVAFVRTKASMEMMHALPHVHTSHAVHASHATITPNQPAMVWRGLYLNLASLIVLGLLVAAIYGALRAISRWFDRHEQAVVARHGT